MLDHTPQWNQFLPNTDRPVLSALCVSLSIFLSAKQKLSTAAGMFLEVVLRRDFPEFITTYLNQDHTFLCSLSCGQAEALDKDTHRSKL